MPLDPEIALDMLETLSALRRGDGLAFTAIPPRGARDAPWLLVGKAAALNARVTAATRKARALGTFRLDAAVEGTVEDGEGGAVFRVAQEPRIPFETMLTGAWVRALKEEGGPLAQLATLLAKATVVVDAALPKADPAELEARFGAAREEVEDAARSVAPRLAALPAPTEPRSSTGLASVLASHPGPVLDHVEPLVPEFLRLAEGGAPSRLGDLGHGDVVDPTDRMLLAGIDVHVAEGLMRDWDAALTEAESTAKRLGDPGLAPEERARLEQDHARLKARGEDLQAEVATLAHEIERKAKQLRTDAAEGR